MKYLDLQDERAKLIESGCGWDEPDTPSSRSDTNDSSDDYFTLMEAKCQRDKTFFFVTEIKVAWN